MDNNPQEENPAAVKMISLKEKKKVIKVKRSKKLKPYRGKRKHRPKDYPKRPLSAYNIFFKEKRQELFQEKIEKVGRANVDLRVVVQEVAQHWKALSSEEKAKLELRAKEDLKRYRDEVEVYEATHDDAAAESDVSDDDSSSDDSSTPPPKHHHNKQRLSAPAAVGARRPPPPPPGSGYALLDASSEPRDDPRMKAYPPPPLVSHHAPPGGAPTKMSALEERRLILEEELRVLDSARELKIRQLIEVESAIRSYSASQGTYWERPHHPPPHHSAPSARSYGGTLLGLPRETEVESLYRQMEISHGAPPPSMRLSHPRGMPLADGVGALSVAAMQVGRGDEGRELREKDYRRGGL
eukprot:Nitzschia sp. Nitz4//scaffold99_size76975//18606//19667//NITZ4_005568-RA/size76975-processed-gene-0.25-mRNA-1//1//CDS//3329560826//7409//frame0